MAVRTPVIGGGGGLQKGGVEGYVVSFRFPIALTITPGQIEANGKIYTASTFSVHVITGFTGGYTVHYMYIDDSASTPPTAVFIDSTTVPVFDSVKNGFYNGDDRYFGTFIEEQAGNAAAVSDTVVMSDRFIRNFVNRSAIPNLSLNQATSGSGSLVLPNVTTLSSTLLPVTAVELNITMSGADAAGQSATVAAASFEWGTEDTAFGNAPFIFSGVQFIRSNGWLPLGPSRDILIGGEVDDNPALTTQISGIGYIR